MAHKDILGEADLAAVAAAEASAETEIPIDQTRGQDVRPWLMTAFVITLCVALISLLTNIILIAK